MAKNVYTAKANRALALTLFFYAQGFGFFMAFLKTRPPEEWFYINGIGFCIGFILGTYFQGDYRLYKKLESDATD